MCDFVEKKEPNENERGNQHCCKWKSKGKHTKSNSEHQNCAYGQVFYFCWAEAKFCVNSRRRVRNLVLKGRHFSGCFGFFNLCARVVFG